ncbi:siphovirus Gp157 family protein [Pseudomonas fontis]|uniref:Siphovirus Gp157 family protein n=1 Tax=Pseudomonas fontis TaxID=2942633 RepID=A0ABT5P016_9PSED|nr:siphovirus Gp157 family protein [Pseudomonas fontis]MDD0977101.1 siphovirus Gp157 family protein [Pseudomonas fontis]MDD0993794.1 siphovirus Gp157 family protein [Pseudomonas fontis]
MSHLYELTGQFRELAILMQDADEDMAVAVRDTMGAIEAEFNEKALAVSRVILNMDGNIEAVDAEIDRLQERKRIMSNRKGQIIDYLRENMEASKITKITCPLLTITLCKGRESVIVDDDKLLDEDLVNPEVTMVPDKKAIAERIKAGQEVKGARLERGQSSIRIK